MVCTVQNMAKAVYFSCSHNQGLYAHFEDWSNCLTDNRIVSYRIVSYRIVSGWQSSDNCNCVYRVKHTLFQQISNHVKHLQIQQPMVGFNH